jgi:hypothetical protein
MSITDVESQAQSILTNIQSLQSIEQDLIGQLTANPNMSQTNKTNLINKIQEIYTMRLNLYNTLRDVSVYFENSLSNSQTTLTQQTQTINVVEQELQKAKMNLKVLEEEKNNKIRMIEINQYYGDKYLEHGALMRILIMILVPILILALLNKYNILPTNIYYILVGIIAAIGGYFFIRRFISILYRDNMNYQAYQWNYNPNLDASSNTSSSDPWLSSSSTGTCVGDACCSTGMTWDSSSNTCTISESFVSKISNSSRYKKPDVVLGGENVSPSYASFMNY